MNVSCPECKSVFRVDPAKVPAAGVRARCSVCSGIIPVPAPSSGAAAVPQGGDTGFGADASGARGRTGEFSTAAHAAWSGSAEVGRDIPSAAVAAPAAPLAQAPAPASAGAGRRPINPFLNKDPNLRAKRLARALVSDIITYQPAKHAEGLRDGTIRDLFKDEIRKSYEEYTAQVGQQLAESTPYFQEALNEVLGAGKKIF
ncbi:MAG: zinc-ribbon domain-containing protein [Gemmatimonadota bacterium]|nr:zinc-ribbon domain-containing protein [Gemmatimonadota bacterium]